MNYLSNAAVRLVVLLLALGAVDSAIGQQTGDCGAFYRKDSFATRVIDKKPVLRVIDVDARHFQLIYEEGYHHRKTLNLFKNATGLQLFAYVKAGDLIKKNTAENTVYVIRPMNNALDVQMFDLGCGP